MKLAFYKAFQPKSKDETYTKYIKRLWLDWLIACASFGKYSHVELVVGDEWFSISPRTGKAQKRKINPKCARWDFVELHLSGVDKDIVMIQVNNYVGFKYDYLGAIFSITPFCIQRSNKIFCSEVTVNVLNHTHKYGWLKDGCRYSPSKLYKILGGSRWNRV